VKKALGAWLILTIFLFFAISGCGNSSSAPASTQGTLELHNDSNATIDRFYLAPVEDASLGSDQAEANIYPNEHRTFVNITPGSHDAKIGVNGPDSDYFAYVYDLPIAAGNPIVLKVYNSSFTGSMELRNNTSAAGITGVYVVPADTAAWGDNQTSSVIGPSGVLHLYDLDPGLYKVKVMREAGPDSIYHDIRVESLALTALNVDSIGECL